MLTREAGSAYRPFIEEDMDPLLCSGPNKSSQSPLLSEESALDHHDSLHQQHLHWQDRRPPRTQLLTESTCMQVTSSSGQHDERSAAYFQWPPLSGAHSSAEERAAYFSGLQKALVPDSKEKAPSGQQATTLLDLMTIRAFHSKELRRYSLGTALGFRTRGGVVTGIPAIIVFVARKVHRQWLHELQRLPPFLEGPGGIWCDVDVIEFSYYGAPAVTPKEQVYTELVEGLRGSDPYIGPGSQVASQETYGTLGAIVRSRTGARQVGFLTNRHVAVDLDYPNQKMFHPLPPVLGPGVYLGAVERATSFITDDLWYNIFASMNPETFVRADGAFIPFGECFDMSRVNTAVKGVGEMGEVMNLDLQAPIGSIVGKQVVKVGRSSGLTKGSIMAYALEYNDEKGICFFTDFLIVGENGQAFDLEGDSGSLILLACENGAKPRPVGIIWGGTANRGRLKLRHGCAPENWTSGVDLGRLLDLLQLSLITSSDELAAAVEEQRRWSAGLSMGPTVVETSAGTYVVQNKDRGGDHHVGFGELSSADIGMISPQKSKGSEPQISKAEAEVSPSVVQMATAAQLKPLDFGLIGCDSPPNHKKQSEKGKKSDNAFGQSSSHEPGNMDSLSFGLHLFDRHVKKRKESED